MRVYCNRVDLATDFLSAEERENSAPKIFLLLREMCGPRGRVIAGYYRRGGLLRVRANRSDAIVI